MYAIPLFASPLLEVREVTCDAPRGGSRGAEETTVPCVALPLRGCFGVERAGREVIADANTALFFDAGGPYHVAHPVEGGDVSFVLTYDAGIVADAFGRGRRRNAEREPFGATHAHLAPTAQLDARLLRRRLSAGDAAGALAVEEQAFALIAQLAGTRAPQLDAARGRSIERAKAYLGERFAETVLLADVARAARSSPFGLTRTFRVATGTTLHRYLVDLRVAAALDALAAGAADLARVAVDSGFAHHSHLTKVVRARLGRTPRAIRGALSS